MSTGGENVVPIRVVLIKEQAEQQDRQFHAGTSPADQGHVGRSGQGRQGHDPGDEPAHGTPATHGRRRTAG